MRVNILSPGAKTPNGAAFLFPLWIFKSALRDQGVDLTFFSEVGDQITDCDTLLVDSKFHRSFWIERTEEVLFQFSCWSEKTRVVYCDTTDSTGSLQVDLLPHIHVYAKSQLLKDKTQYSEIHYAERLFADYYHREFGLQMSLLHTQNLLPIQKIYKNSDCLGIVASVIIFCGPIYWNNYAKA